MSCPVCGLWKSIEPVRVCAKCEEKTSIETLRRELAETRAVLSDVLEARGESWLAQLAGRREELLTQLGYAERLGDYEVCSSCHDIDPAERGSYENGLHVAKCPLASLLRVTGGDVETQRQVDAAHEAALHDRRVLADRIAEWRPSAVITSINREARSITYRHLPGGDDE